jgi:hypothetical protein
MDLHMIRQSVVAGLFGVMLLCFAAGCPQDKTPATGGAVVDMKGGAGPGTGAAATAMAPPSPKSLTK